jgi:hypothetical protein
MGKRNRIRVFFEGLRKSAAIAALQRVDFVDTLSERGWFADGKPSRFATASIKHV